MELPAQRTLEIGCPDMFARVDLFIPGPHAAPPVGQDTFQAILRAALRHMYGAAGAGAGAFELLGPVAPAGAAGGSGGSASGSGCLQGGGSASACSGSGSATAVLVRTPKEAFGRLLAACAATSSYDGTPCTLSITAASPHLACLAPGPQAAAGQCLQQLHGGLLER